jgi:hypothetical protein
MASYESGCDHVRKAEQGLLKGGGISLFFQGVTDHVVGTLIQADPDPVNFLRIDPFFPCQL